MKVEKIRPPWLTWELYPFEDKWINIDGNTIHYIDEGKGDTILFSHPAVSWSFMYRNLVKILSRKYRCIAIDYPGFGLSGAAGNYTYSVSSQASVLKQFILSMELENIYVLGHDSGGPSAYAACINIPERVAGFIISDAIIFPVSEYAKISKMLGIVSGGLFRFLNSRFNILIRLASSKGIRNRVLHVAEKKCYTHAFDTHNKRNHAVDVLASLKKEEPLMKKLHQSFETIFQNIPALLIYGEKDPVHQLGISHRIRNLLPYAELHLVPGEAHFPYEGESEQIALVIEKWVMRHIPVIK